MSVTGLSRLDSFMIPKIVFLIRSNPEESHKPAEAIRIAAGLGVGKNPLKIILTGEAPRILLSDEEDLIDVDIIEKFLPLVRDMSIPVYVDKRSVSGMPVKKSHYDFRIIEPEESSELLAGGHYVLVF